MVADRLQPDQASADQTGIAAVEVGTGVAGLVFFAPLRRWRGVAEDVVVGVEGVNVRAPVFEFRIQRQAQQAAVAGPVDVGAQVGEDFRRRVFDVFEDEDSARLLRDEDTAVGSETEVGRLFEVADRNAVLEAFRQGGLSGSGGGGKEEGEKGGD